MKKITLNLIAIAGTLGLSSCTAKKAMNKKMCCNERKIEIATCFAGHGHSDSNAHYAEYGLNLDFMDKSVRPQDNFYNYVNEAGCELQKSLLTKLLGEVSMN